MYLKSNDSSNSSINITISDINGAIVFEENQLSLSNGAASININELSNGVYFVSIYNHEIRLQQKIVIIK